MLVLFTSGFDGFEQLKHLTLDKIDPTLHIRGELDVAVRLRVRELLSVLGQDERMGGSVHQSWRFDGVNGGLHLLVTRLLA